MHHLASLHVHVYGTYMYMYACVLHGVYIYSTCYIVQVCKTCRLSLASCIHVSSLLIQTFGRDKEIYVYFFISLVIYSFCLCLYAVSTCKCICRLLNRLVHVCCIHLYDRPVHKAMPTVAIDMYMYMNNHVHSAPQEHIERERKDQNIEGTHRTYITSQPYTSHTLPEFYS